LDEIKTVEGVEEKVAKKIYNFFHEWNLNFQIIWQ
jgi:excinuclease ABC subunit C